MSNTTFDQLGLPADLVAALSAQRITEPFAIQALALPDALDGRDILGRAPTGSGKTLAFGLPALARLAATGKASKRRPKALILSPTRELAEQIHRELGPLAGSVKRRVTSVYGGAAVGRQISALAKGVDLLVATPGRLLDLIDQGEVALDQVEVAVVDEADRMADMGFLPDVRRLLDQTRPDRQTLLFSATLDGDVQALTDRYQRDPALHEIGDPEPDLSAVDHRFIRIAKTKRIDLAADLIDTAGSTVVFVRTRHGVDRLARQLRERGVKAGYIHGGRSQSQRSRALALFTDGKVDALVATDVAARGIHVDGVACVLHYDPPAETKDYVHRSGRTARAGAAGTVISLLDPSQVKASQAMQIELGIEADLEEPPEVTPRQKTGVERPTERRNGRGKSGTASTRKSSRSSSKRGEGSRVRADRASSDPSSTSDGTKSGPTGRGGARSDGSKRSGTKPGQKRRGPTSGGPKSGGPKSGGPKRRSRSTVSAGDERRRGRPAGGEQPSAESSPSHRAGKPGRSGKPAGPGKAKAKPKAKRSATGARATKRTGRSRPPNRKGKFGAKGRRSGSSGS
ncbi:MAG: DEAD/DEAH box helicase [Actinomycetota bacterium]